MGRADNQPRTDGQSITIPQSELLHHGDHASLTICGFIALPGWSMIDIIQSGKRENSAKCP
ncbi:hypothetical protein ACVIW2_006604 [Bradyrhizobium huanghuaihaiense]|uniref:hypothetical protein n=1 Tax=Bradyrhizobium huanghuaihaiense TaxID=990078 RepID=UPI00036FE26D|nr:hypothetical protein [Bradyrhizobium huanghuaihaiense]